MRSSPAPFCHPPAIQEKRAWPAFALHATARFGEPPGLNVARPGRLLLRNFGALGWPTSRSSRAISAVLARPAGLEPATLGLEGCVPVRGPSGDRTWADSHSGPHSQRTR